MVNVICNQGRLDVKGTVDLGYLGKYSKINIDEDYIESEITENLAKEIENNINELETKVQNNLKEFNNTFLYHVLDYMVSIEFPFWEIDKITNKKDILKNPEEYYSEELQNICPDLYDEYMFASINGGKNKTDIEELMKNKLPAFNIDNFISLIKPTTLTYDTINFCAEMDNTLGNDLFYGNIEISDENSYIKFQDVDVCLEVPEDYENSLDEDEEMNL